MEEIRRLALAAQTAARKLGLLSESDKNRILDSMAQALEEQSPAIAAANEADLAAAHQAGLQAALLDRLALNPARLRSMIQAVEAVRALPDPVGQVIESQTRPNGLRIRKVAVPIGVVAVMYEARPNVTCDAAVLNLKASNATILRGGKEALRTNLAIVQALRQGGEKAGMPSDSIQLVSIASRDAIRALVQMEGLVDLVIPRGGEALIRAITEHARVPVIKNAKGLCHTFVDESADISVALAVCENAKCQRPGVCNAMETLLVHENIAETFLPEMVRRYRVRGVEVRGCDRCCRIVKDLVSASEKDWETEYLDLIISIRIVSGLDEALAHIARYGSKHSEAIIARIPAVQQRFLREVDAAAVYVNASTRFTDGGEFGLGAEIGISTDKLHARGPMGVRELTTYKYQIEGTGQIRC